MTAKFAENTIYTHQERLLLELHRLSVEGLADDAAADRVRDEIDETWWDLTAEEQDRINGLSGDLYMLQEQEVFEPVDDVEVAATLEAELNRAMQARRWDEVLILLRRRPRNASAETVAILRARAYRELGHPLPADLFFDYALGLDDHRNAAAAAVYSRAEKVAA